MPGQPAQPAAHGSLGGLRPAGGGVPAARTTVAESLASAALAGFRSQPLARPGTDIPRGPRPRGFDEISHPHGILVRRGRQSPTRFREDRRVVVELGIRSHRLRLGNHQRLGRQHAGFQRCIRDIKLSQVGLRNRSVIHRLEQRRQFPVVHHHGHGPGQQAHQAQPEHMEQNRHPPPFALNNRPGFGGGEEVVDE